MEEECARYRCEGEDGSPITVLEFQYFDQAETKPGRRRYPGAQRLESVLADLNRLRDSQAG